MPEKMKTFGALQRERTREVFGPPKDNRPSPSAQGYDRQWQKVRLLVLARDQYRCQNHWRFSGQLVEATEVDHIQPIAKGGARYDPANLQSLCASCHARKTATEDGGFGRGKGRLPAPSTPIVDELAKRMEARIARLLRSGAVNMEEKGCEHYR